MFILVGEYKNYWTEGVYEWTTEIISIHKTKEGLEKKRDALKKEGKYFFLRSHTVEAIEE